MPASAAAPVRDPLPLPGPGAPGCRRAKVAMLLALVRQLQGVIQAENALLSELRLERLHQLQAEKADLVAGYGLALRQLRHAPALLAAAGEEDRRSLDAAIRALQVAFRGQAKRLALARTTVDDVARAIDESLGDADHGCGLVLRPRLVAGG